MTDQGPGAAPATDGDFRHLRPLQWAQQLHWILSMIPGSSDTLCQVIGVPTGLAAPEVVDAIQTLANRHESLRTRYEFDSSGDPCQIVERRWPVEIDEHDVEPMEADSRDYLAMVNRLSTVDFDLAARPPVRATLVRVAGVLRWVVLVAHHVAVDTRGMDLLKQELIALLDGEDLGPATQPSGHAGWELTEAGRRANERSQQRWSRYLDLIPNSLFPAKTSRPGRRIASLASSRIGWAAAVVAKQLGVSPPAVLLAAFGGLVLSCAGRPDGVVMTFCSNRFRPLSNAASCLYQVSPVHLRFSDNPTFEEFIKRTHNEHLAAQLTACYDYNQQHAALLEASMRRGMYLQRWTMFNYIAHREWHVGDRPPQQADSAVGPSPLTFETGSESKSREMELLVYDHGDRVGLELDIEFGLLTDRQIEELLRGIEAAVVSLASGANPTMTELAGMLGPEPVQRIGQWRAVGGSHIDLAAVERLVSEHPMVASATVQDCPADDIECTVTVASKYRGRVSSEMLRLFCLARLPGFPNAAIPARFHMRPHPSSSLRAPASTGLVVDGVNTGRAPHPEWSFAEHGLMSLLPSHGGQVQPTDVSYFTAGGRVDRMGWFLKELGDQGFVGLDPSHLLSWKTVSELASLLRSAGPGSRDGS